MKNITIYHNPRCSKSRQALALLNEKGADFKVTEYLKEVPTKKELEDILNKLGISADELVRKGEAIWKEKFKGKNMTSEELIEAMIKFPKLIERPIVIADNKAIVGRPPELVLDLI